MFNNYLIYALLIIGSLAILSNIFDTKWIISQLFTKKNANVQTEKGREESFLHIVSLWYQLKDECDKFNLKVASSKLDEVFPLLNGVLEDEKVA